MPDEDPKPPTEPPVETKAVEIPIKTQTKSKKRLKVLIAILVGLAVVFTGWLIYDNVLNLPFRLPPELTKRKQTKTNKIESPLDGTMAIPELANRHPLAIMIENHPDARPHVGLEQASLIYEAITEGGITRFMTVYGPRDADKVGPARSARTYFLDWAAEFDAFYAHAGGSVTALQRLKSEGYKDLEQFSIGTKAFWREPEKGKAVEHTLFTSTKKLYDVARSKKWELQYTGYEKYKFKDDPPESQRGTATKTTIDFSSAAFKVVWEYNPAKNNYLRSMGGSEHKDRISGKQLQAKNVIIQIVNRTFAPTSIGEQVYVMDTIGEGKAKVLLDGKTIDAAWKKASRTARTKFYDPGGNEIQFNRGLSWIEIVPPGTPISSS